MTAKEALEAITRIAGNLNDDSITGKTGPNDARQRGLMVVSARNIARRALSEMSPGLTVRIDGAECVPLGDVRINISFPDNRSLIFVFTGEGIISDAFSEDGESVGTSSIMYDERYEQLLPKRAHGVIARLQDEFAGKYGSALDDIVLVPVSMLPKSTTKASRDYDVPRDWDEDDERCKTDKNGDRYQEISFPRKELTADQKCENCETPYSEDSINGGRCVNCGRMIS